MDCHTRYRDHKKKDDLKKIGIGPIAMAFGSRGERLGSTPNIRKSGKV